MHFVIKCARPSLYWCGNPTGDQLLLHGAGGIRTRNQWSVNRTFAATFRIVEDAIAAILLIGDVDLFVETVL